ncbi:MAG TPA: hypothetical protein DEF79_09865 [Gammaproteobacteria bacterium]|mgnify:FL=1|nr:hypothetical protein [Gammaproteobacteria bacterium]
MEGILLCTMGGKTQRRGAVGCYFGPAGTEHMSEFPENNADIKLWINKRGIWRQTGSGLRTTVPIDSGHDTVRLLLR